MKPEKRKQILEVTEKLFNRFGIRRTGIDEIAQLANVAKGTIYNYFESKDGLFKALAKEKIASFEELLSKTTASLSDPVEKTRTALMAHLRFVINNPFLSDKLLYGQYDQKIKTVLANLDETSRKIISKILLNGRRKKRGKEADKAIVNTLMYTLRGMVDTIRTRMDTVSIENFEKEIEYLVKALLNTHLIEQKGAKHVDG